MPRSPFAPARVTNTAPFGRPSSRTWTPGHRTLRRAQRRQRAAPRADRSRKGQIDPWSVRIVSRGCKGVGRAAHWLLRTYPKARSFLLAHAAGIVSPGQTVAREACCGGCPYGYERDGEFYCRGANGGRGCGCGHRPVSRRKYKLRLAAFRCPQGRFGFGGLAVWLFRK